jgi:hypothetical protein
VSESDSIKFCRTCGTDQPIEEFGQRYDRPQRKSQCKACIRSYMRERNRELNISKRDYWRRKNRDPDYHRRFKLKARYGITVEEYWEMHSSQEGLCAICDQPEKRKLRGNLALLVVDHCHSTGKVRGLLCFHCNKTLGHLENADWIDKAFGYLKGVSLIDD